MNDYFIENIEIQENKHIQKLEIPLSKEKRQHLIFTGKNGSGKTTTLKEINTFLNNLIDNGFVNAISNKEYINAYDNVVKQDKNIIKDYEKEILIQNTQKKSLEKLEATETNKAQIVKCDDAIKNYNFKIIAKEDTLENWKKQADKVKIEIQNFSKVNLTFSKQDEVYESIVKRYFILAYFEAKRDNSPKVSNTIKNIKLDTDTTTNTKKLHKKFIEYMVKQRTDMLNDKFDGDGKKSHEIQKWFDNFEKTLKTLFNEPNLILKYYSEELNFKIEYQGKSFGLNELSDGYSSLLAILTELILRMEAHKVKVYDMQGVVLIDEIETHLHVDLQKKILPFLVDFFPKIQFIVTTHSPFVLSSLSNAVICDLEKNFITQDLSIYSYDAIIESYFDSDKYSQEIKDKLELFEVLSKKKELDEKEKDKYLEFKRYFKRLPTFMAYELAVKINEILLNDLDKK